MNKTGMDSDFDAQTISYKFQESGSLAKPSGSKRGKSFSVHEKTILTAFNKKNEVASKDINDRVRRVDRLLANYGGADKLKESFA